MTVQALAERLDEIRRRRFEGIDPPEIVWGALTRPEMEARIEEHVASLGGLENLNPAARDMVEKALHGSRTACREVPRSVLRWAGLDADDRR